MFTVAFRGTLVGMALIGAAVLLPASASSDISRGDTLVLSGHAANNIVVVRGTGSDRGTYSINGSRPIRFSGVRSITINGHGGADVCRIINPRHGLLAPPDGITCNGGNRRGAPRRGVLDTVGGSASHTAYVPARVAGSGVQVGQLGSLRQTIHFSGLAPVTSSVAALNTTVNFTSDSNDTVALVSGSTAGTWTVESLASKAESQTFSNVANVTINTGANDVLLLENTATESGSSYSLTNLSINANGPVVAAGANDASASVTITTSSGAVSGAGPAPQLSSGQLNLNGPAGVGPISVSSPGLAAIASNGNVSVTDGSSASVSSVSAAGDVALTVPGGDLLSLTGAVSAPTVTLSADTMSLTGGSVSASTGATLEPATAGVPVNLGPTAKAAGQLNLSPADLSAVTTPALTIGDAGTGQINVTAPVTRASGLVTLTGPAGIGGASGASLSVPNLVLTDLGSGGRPWVLTPASVSDGTGSPLSYSGASTLTINAGPGSDTFDVTPSGSTTDEINGGAPSSLPGDTLTYEAGGRTLTGSPQAGNGELQAAGVAAVGYSGIETVNVANPGGASGTTSTTATPTVTVSTPTPLPAPHCSIDVTSTRITLPRTKAARSEPLALLATCDQSAKAVLSGRLIETPKTTRTSAKRVRTKTFTLAASHVAVTAGHISQITLRIPAAAVQALRAGASESVKLTLTATGSTATSTVSATIKRLTS